MKEWNVVVVLLSVSVLLYLGVATYAFAVGKVDLHGFKEFVYPVVTAAMGYFAGMLKKPAVENT